MSQSEEVLIRRLRGENPGGETENQILSGGVGGGEEEWRETRRTTHVSSYLLIDKISPGDQVHD